MLVTNGTLAHRFEEIVHKGMRLGRHMVLDARSLAYTVERDVRAMGVPIRPAEHVPPIPTLDQGALGSCVGNAGTYALAALVGVAGLPDVDLNGHTLAQDRDDEAFAVELYHEATVDDGFPGEYPPDDTGSSGLGACRALRAAELISRYRWATSIHGVAALLQAQGAIIGMPWLEEFFDPDAHGFIDTGRLDSPVAGGHEVYVEALETWNVGAPPQSVIRVRNSWGTSWGDHGCFRMRLSTYNRLKQQIDVKQLAA